MENIFYYFSIFMMSEKVWKDKGMRTPRILGECGKRYEDDKYSIFLYKIKIKENGRHIIEGIVRLTDPDFERHYSLEKHYGREVRYRKRRIPAEESIII